MDGRIGRSVDVLSDGTNLTLPSTTRVFRSKSETIVLASSLPSLPLPLDPCFACWVKMGARNPQAQAIARRVHDGDPRLQPGALVQPLQDRGALADRGGSVERNGHRRLLLRSVDGEELLRSPLIGGSKNGSLHCLPGVWNVATPGTHVVTDRSAVVVWGSSRCGGRGRSGSCAMGRARDVEGERARVLRPRRDVEV